MSMLPDTACIACACRASPMYWGFKVTCPGAVIIGREIAMSALRELAASLGGNAYKAVAVSSWGKWKTATQVPLP